MKLKIKKFIQSISGRTKILISSFIFTLLGFSIYVYVTVHTIEKNYSEFIKHWHALQVNLFTTFGVYPDIQYSVMNAIYNQESDTTGLNSNMVSEANSYNTSFKVHLDSVSTNFDYISVIEAEKNNFKNAIKMKIAILNRIAYLKNNHQSNLIFKDSLIHKVYLPKISESVGNYWGSFFPSMLNGINSGTKNSDDNITNSYKSFQFIVLIITFILILIYIYSSQKFIYKLKKSISQPIGAINQLATGELKTLEIQINDELAEVIHASNNLSQNLSKASKFAIEISKGNFDHNFEAVGSQDTLGNALIHMRNELKKYAEKEKQTTWINFGIAKFAQILRKQDTSLQDISYVMLHELIKYLDANQGGIFVYDKDSDTLHQMACHAYNRKKQLEKTIQKYEGLVGQCFLEAEHILITDLPPSYIHITSGLGYATPKVLLLMPLIYNDQVLGVLELASFNNFEDYKIEFIRKVAENFASLVYNITKNDLTKKLLEDSTLNRENIKQKEEEMRQNIEELTAIQEEMKRKELYFIEEIARLKIINSSKSLAI